MFGGYVSEEPVCQAYNRPCGSSNNYVCIEGGWSWNIEQICMCKIMVNEFEKIKGKDIKKGRWKKTTKNLNG